MALLTVLLMMPDNCLAAGKHRFTLVIDAGHGGKDPGTMTKKVKEKNINLNVALAFGRYVEQNLSDVKVIYTRKTDVFVPLHERADIANRNKADVFISIHTNAVKGKSSVNGLETYTMGMRRLEEKLSAAMRENEVVTLEENYQQHYSGFDPRQPESYIIFDIINDANILESIELAKGIQKFACKASGRMNKGVKQDAFLVLRETSMPACLIELGYITNPQDEAYLNSKIGVDALARGIYQAFAEYKSKRTKGTVSPTPKQVKDSDATKETKKPEEKKDTVKPVAKKDTVKPVVKNDTVKPVVKKDTVKPVVKKDTVKPVAKKDTVKHVAKKDAVKDVKNTDKQEDNAVIFKVQLMVSDKKVSTTDKLLKGVKNVECYQENGMWKYTVGASTDYNEITKLKKQMQKDFPQAFIVKFKNGKRIK